MGIPIPEFKVLLYGPELNPAGLRARARFEGNVLAVIAHDRTRTVPAQELSLETGGYDGRQWLIIWTAREGRYSAMLQGEQALKAFIRLAPPKIGQQLARARKSHAIMEHRFILGLILLVIVLFLALWLLWANADHLSQWAVSHISLEQEQLGDLTLVRLHSLLDLVEQVPAAAYPL